MSTCYARWLSPDQSGFGGGEDEIEDEFGEMEELVLGLSKKVEKGMEG